MPLLDIFWTMLMLFLWVAWIWVVIRVFADIVRADMSGWAKAGWSLFVVVIPWLGVLIYLVVNGRDMGQRDVEAVRAVQEQQADYIRGVVGGPGSAEQLEKLASLRDRGVISEDEFQSQKAKVLA